MVATKSLDNLEVIVHLLRDIMSRLGVTPRSIRLTVQKTRKRYEREGMSFLTKALPRLGKALDRALSSDDPLDLPYFQKKSGTSLPIFLGELFSRIFDSAGRTLPTPDVNCIIGIRQLAYAFYKYKLPFDRRSSQTILDQFVKTDQDLASVDLSKIDERVIGRARTLLARVFQSFDAKDIIPRHGPGAVADRLKRSEKYRWHTIPHRTASVYPIDEYYFVSQTHVCDRYKEQLFPISGDEPSARIILVPKDSRGPRIISAEPSALQWLQQGIMRKMVDHIERHPLTRGQVNFTDQTINRAAALAGSVTGDTVTLDLKEASDRVSTSLVRLLWPEPLLESLLATRSTRTQLPDGRIIMLNKFAPMGSALCFPVLAMTCWALLSAANCAGESRETLLVYGDDIIVPQAKAHDAITVLESAGLLVNRDKSCLRGSFRESCGMDAFLGHSVTPIRFKTVWSPSPAASVYTSWIAYCNSLWNADYCSTAQYIASELVRIYRSVPERDYPCGYPHLCFPVTGTHNQAPKQRVNKSLQRLEYRVLESENPKLEEDYDGWHKLLRYFTEGTNVFHSPSYSNQVNCWSKSSSNILSDVTPMFHASTYTIRKRNKLRYRWR